jgi:hypothetical protein
MIDKLQNIKSNILYLTKRRESNRYSTPFSSDTLMTDCFELICHGRVAGECEHSTCQNKGHSDTIYKTKWRSSLKLFKRLWLNFSNLWRPAPYIKIHRRYPQENNGMHTRETGSIGSSVFTVFRYSVPSNGLTRNSRFPIQGNVAKVHKRKCLPCPCMYFFFCLEQGDTKS